MRPPGEVRQAMLQAALTLTRDGLGGATFKQMAVCAKVGFSAARLTADNLARAGQLVVIGLHRVEGVNRPMRLYAPPPPPDADDQSTAALNGWAAFR